ncbi:ArsR family transcriptional regulator [Pelagibacterium lacus]|uniref:ArsR family transcriptional regulator n=2 Tax=Pelagibacterium lacus TaxID=2282655 RepID=A0A369W358_9HYPH|nr:ArsR family transcriptional regulator [Pelagibacterium lacus]
MQASPMSEDEIAAMMRALGHPVRLEILRILSARADSCCCNDVTDCLDLAQSTVSQHLKVLLDAGVIERHAQGTRNNYRVRHDRLSGFTGAMERYFDQLGTDAASCARASRPQPAA